MENNYFVTIDGDIISSNITQSEAIKIGKKRFLNGCNIGIGKTKIVNGQKKYTLLPLYFYLD